MRLDFGIEGENCSVKQFDILIKLIKGVFFLSVDFKGKRAIDEMVLAAYVRLLHHAGQVSVPAYSSDVERYHAG